MTMSSRMRQHRGGRRILTVACVTVAVVALVVIPASQALGLEPPTAVEAAPHSDSQPATGLLQQLSHVLLLRDYNTRVVVIGTTLLGIAAGVIGTFAYLRKRALMGDALSHATLPGIAIVFLFMGTKHQPTLLLGAAVFGVLGVLAVLGLSRIRRIREDAAIGIVLSVFFGFGTLLLSVIQRLRTGDEAGLQNYIYGNAASMLAFEAEMTAITAVCVLVCVLLLFKEFRLVCFDQEFARALGYSVFGVDVAMMALVVLTTVVGLQAVGLIMIVALLIIPPAAARFWCDRLLPMLVISAAIGGFSGWGGALISAMLPRMPTGAVIVLCAGCLFGISLAFAPQRGVLSRLLQRWSLRTRTSQQNLLRALAEWEEQQGDNARVSQADLLHMRRWSTVGLRREIARALRWEKIAEGPIGRYHLTSNGREEARRILRNHRLWELYLIRYADIATSHVDYGADRVEHVLSDRIVKELEALLEAVPVIPPSPHQPEVVP